MTRAPRGRARLATSAAPIITTASVLPPSPTLPVKRLSRARTARPSTLEEPEEDASEIGEEKSAALSKKRKVRTPKTEYKDELDGGSDLSDEIQRPPATTKKRKERAAKKAVKKEENDQSDYADEGAADTPEPKPKKSRKRKVDPESIIYEIPDVPSRDFIQEGYAASESIGKAREAAGGFVGRLGYACLNTILRQRDPPVFSSRTARLKTIEEKGLETVIELARQNVRDMIPMLEWNAANGIHFMRLSSELLPFASHKVHGYSPKLLSRELAEAGEAVKRLNHRVTMHPGQFCQLGTPSEEILEATVRDLEVHSEILDLMGVGPDGVMIIHGGGTYGDRQATLERIKMSIMTRLSPTCRARLVLENDEMGYSAEELLPLCTETGTPLVFDFHHDLLRPSSQPPSVLLPIIKRIWDARGIKPKYHLSEPRPGAKNLPERRAHSDRCVFLPPDLPPDADLMIEAKDKEQAVFELRRIYGLQPVIHTNLRPPADEQTTATGGRKKAAAATGSQGERDQALLTVQKAKAVALKRGLKYVGPGADPEEGAPAPPRKLTGEEVLEQMKVEADWVRNELREGRDRRSFPGAEDTLQKEAAANADFEEEGMAAGNVQA